MSKGQEMQERSQEAVKLISQIREADFSSPNSTEQEFLAQMAVRADEWGDRMYVSEKQLFWLRDIHLKSLEANDDCSTTKDS